MPSLVKCRINRHLRGVFLVGHGERKRTPEEEARGMREPWTPPNPDLGSSHDDKYATKGRD